EMAPGTVVDTHAHDIDEECYVISGDIAFGQEALGPGDFHVAPAGSRHGHVSSRGGCLCLIVTAM
ncbi:cupin domain-containing protein, partial [Pseudomonas aeruginosa]|uniref:cupin domain-containing protein n=1 Tax=Pseudomonas aeruginosa TaxID=287 RepID=UPI002F95F408